MSQLTANTQIAFEVGDQNNLPIKASTEIFLGSAVGLTSGYARQLVAADLFGGFADAHVNNNIATDGAMSIPVKRSGMAVLSITSAAVTDIGKVVYASDGNTFTFTATGNTRIGVVVRWISTGKVVVSFNAGTQRTNISITDSTGGAASTTFAAITAPGANATTSLTADMTAVKNALAEIALVLNTLS